MSERVVQSIAISDIKVDPAQRRELHDVKSLAESIQTIGLLAPIIVTKDYRLVAGYHRLKAVQSLGRDKIDCIVQDLNDLQARLLEIDENLIRNELSVLERAEQYKERKRIYEQLYPETQSVRKRGGPGRGNKTRTPSVLDSDRKPSFVADTAQKTNRSLTAVKEEVQIASNIDHSLKDKLRHTPFANNKKDLLNLSRLDESDQKKAVGMALNKKTKDLKSAINYVKRAKRIQPQIFIQKEKDQDHSFFQGDAREGIRRLPDRSVSLLLTDPPYGVSYQAGRRGYDNTVEKAIQNDENPEAAVSLLDEVLEQLQPKMSENHHVYIFTSWKTYPEMIRVVQKYVKVQSVLVWDKGVHGQGNTDYWAPQHEWIIFGTRGQRPLIGSRPIDIIKFPKVSGTVNVHPTQKTVELLEFLIQKSSLPGELVLDPFSGSGSTLVAAKKLNRRYFGCEIDEEWHQEGLKRLSELEESDKKKMPFQLPTTGVSLQMANN